MPPSAMPTGATSPSESATCRWHALVDHEAPFLESTHEQGQAGVISLLGIGHYERVSIEGWCVEPPCQRALDLPPGHRTVDGKSSHLLTGIVYPSWI